MFTALYGRVSGTGQDVASQLPDMHAWANKHIGETVWYKDSFTGTTMNRKGFNRLLADCRTGKVETIVIWRLDRLGRTAAGLTALFNELISLRVNLVSIRDGLDLSTPAGRLMANVLASVAQFETEVRSERIKAGISVAKAKGKTWGGRIKGIRVKVTNEQLNMVHTLKHTGTNISTIARTTGLSRPTIYNILNA